MESLEPLFEVVNGLVVPRLPYTTDGSMLRPNGAELLSAEQAAAKFDRGVDSLRAAWSAAFSFLDLPNAANKGDATPPLPAPMRNAMDVLHQVLFPDLDDAQFEATLHMHRERRLNPWLKQLVPVIRPDERTRKPVLSFITTISAFRTIAERTHQYQGWKGPYFCGTDGKWTRGWIPDEPPVLSRVGVRRLGYSGTSWGIAKWSSYCPMIMDERSGRAVPDAFWLRMPDTMLSKCAEAIALRMAFPDELSGLYTDDEMRQAGSSRAFASRPPAEDDVIRIDRNTGEVLAANAPGTWREFERQLMGVGLVDKRQRENVIDHFCDKWPGLIDHDERKFFSDALREVRASPAHYARLSSTRVAS